MVWFRRHKQPTARESQAWMTTRRIESLTDGVVAIALTLLVLNLEVPKVPVKYSSLVKALIKLSPQLYDYAIAFLVLSSFWAAHHRQFFVYKRADNGLLWINVLDLMLIALIPFTVSLMGEFRSLQPAALAFELNILLIGLVKYWQWSYATKDRRLVDTDFSDKEIERGRRINMVSPAISLAAIAISFISPSYSTTIYLVTPFVISRLRRY